MKHYRTSVKATVIHDQTVADRTVVKVNEVCASEVHGTSSTVCYTRLHYTSKGKNLVNRTCVSLCQKKLHEITSILVFIFSII
jgi:hypothetical protein